MSLELLPCPLERLQIPRELDGRQGRNRAPAGPLRQLAADDDLRAIETWLAEFRDSPQTHRHYRKEAERLLLWALIERHQALSDLRREDCVAYEAFLADPQPRQRWCGPKAPRFSNRWKPFQGPLGPASQRTTVLVINSLFSYLVEGGYLAGNPLALMRRRNRVGTAPGKGTERYLEHEQWQALLETVEAMPRESLRQRRHHERLRFLVALLYLLGPRVSEIADSTMGSFVEIRGHWWWQVIGKGQKAARVPVNQDMLTALRRYRESLELAPLPQPDDAMPLVLSLNGTSRISDNMIYRIIKELVLDAADHLEARDPHQADKLRRASTHWFRHTSITHQADAGIDLRHLQRNARHAKLDTTGIYLHAEDAEWHRAMERHRLRSGKS
jgi:site-specific recombinase XerD